MDAAPSPSGGGPSRNATPSASRNGAEAGLLDAAALSAFKVLFLTEPDLPLAGGAALLKWVSAGGTLVTVAGAGQFDEYDEPNPNFQTGLLGKGLVEKPKARSIASPANTVNGTLSAEVPSKKTEQGSRNRAEDG